MPLAQNVFTVEIILVVETNVYSEAGFWSLPPPLYRYSGICVLICLDVNIIRSKNNKIDTVNT